MVVVLQGGTNLEHHQGVAQVLADQVKAQTTRKKQQLD
jgi:hypothetical protein